MSKPIITRSFPTLSTTLILLLGAASFTRASDQFSLSIGPKDNLLVLDASGGKVAELPSPSIARTLRVGDSSFQISYGRDANDQFAAIITPNPKQPRDLHFNVLHKEIHADDKATVTLTFPPQADQVNIDPGYMGLVTVDSQPLPRRQLSDEAPTEPQAQEPVSAPSQPLSPPALPVSQDSAVTVASNDATTSSSSADPKDVTQRPAPSHADTFPNPSMPEPLAPTKSVLQQTSEPLAGTDGGSKPADGSTPPTPYFAPQPMNQPGQLAAVALQPVNSERYFWSEPITPPGGTPPPVASDEMKLVEVQGSVSIKLADGQEKPASDGTVLPSGASVVTSANASAAVFMGGVNSARLLPDTNVKISQETDGSVRHTTLDLRQGTVFSRVGRREGESQDYRVDSPEGVAAARGTEFAVHRAKDKNGVVHFYVFVAKGTVKLSSANGQTSLTLTGKSSHLGMGAVPPAGDEMAVLQNILEVLQPFNLKLALVLQHLYDHTATNEDIAFYNAIVQVFFGQQLPRLLDRFRDNPLDAIPLARRALNQDLEPFGTVPLTGF